MLTPDATFALVARARRGEAAAFTGLVAAYLRPAYVVALAIVGRPADAEDVAQEALAVACERLESCREPERFAGWLLQIVRNRARNWLAARRLREAAPEDGGGEPCPGAALPPAPEAAELRARLIAALGALPVIQREVVLLHDLAGWTHGEIGAASGISEVMSRQHLFQARRALRATLADAAHSEVEHAG